MTPESRPNSSTDGPKESRGIQKCLNRTDVGRREYVKLGMTAAIGTTVIGSVPATGATDSKFNRLAVSSLDHSGLYEFTVTENFVEPAEASSDLSRIISGRNAEGIVTSTEHAYRFSGELTDIQTDGSLLLRLSGIPTTSPLFGAPGTIRIGNANRITNYNITVSGNIDPEPDSSSVNAPGISGHNVEGTISDHIHAYRYSGGIMNVEIDGEASVFINERSHTS